MQKRMSDLQLHDTALGTMLCLPEEQRGHLITEPTLQSKGVQHGGALPPPHLRTWKAET